MYGQGHNPSVSFADTAYAAEPLCRCATSPHAVGSHPLHKGGFAVAVGADACIRPLNPTPPPNSPGEHCSPIESCVAEKHYGRIWNPPLRQPKVAFGPGGVNPFP